MTEEKSFEMETDVPREDMVSKAVEFLQHPKVQSTTLAQRRAFLTKKGLTDEEVSLAVGRSGVSVEAAVVPVAAQNSTPSAYQALQPRYTPVAPGTIWSRVYDITSMCMMVGGISYGVYHVLRKYILPIWMGPSDEEKQLEALKVSLSELEASIGQLVQGMNGVQDSINKQSSTVTQLTLNQAEIRSKDTLQRVTESGGLQEIRSEITSLKGLLLSRNQFPKTPRTQPVLPSWQLTDNSQQVSAAEPVQTVHEPLISAVTSDTACSMKPADNIQVNASESPSFSPVVELSGVSMEQGDLGASSYSSVPVSQTAAIYGPSLTSSQSESLTSAGETPTEQAETTKE